MQDHFLGITGLPISTYFSAYKFRWLLENDAAVREAVEAGTCLLGTVDAWLLHNLTGAARLSVSACEAQCRLDQAGLKRRQQGGCQRIALQQVSRAR